MCVYVWSHLNDWISSKIVHLKKTPPQFQSIYYIEMMVVNNLPHWNDSCQDKFGLYLIIQWSLKESFIITHTHLVTDPYDKKITWLWIMWRFI